MALGSLGAPLHWLNTGLAAGVGVVRQLFSHALRCTNAFC